MAISNEEFQALVELLQKALSSQPQPKTAAEGDKTEGAKDKADQSSGLRKYQLTKMTTEELLKQTAAMAEINLIEAKHNKFIGDKAAARENLRAVEEQIEALQERAAASYSSMSKEQQKAIDDQKEALEASRDELMEYVGSLDKMTPAQQKAHREGVKMANGIAGALGMMSNATEGYLGGILEGISNISGKGGIGAMTEGFMKTFSAANIVNSAVQTIVVSSLQMAVAVESANAALARTTGQGRRFAGEVESIALANTNLGVTADGVSKAYGALVGNTSNFNSMSEATRMRVAETAAQLERLGVSLTDSSAIIDLFNNALGMSGTEAAGLVKDIAVMGNAIGISAEKMTKDFNASLATLAVYGKDSVKVFTGVAAAAKAAGVEASDLLGIANQFETFSSAAEAAGKLNAILGSSISPTQLLTMSEEQRIETLIMQVQASGMAFNQMDKFTQKAIAATVGITDMSKANKIFGMSVSKYREYTNDMKNTAASQEEMNKKLAAAMTLADKVKGAFLSLAIGLEPVISAIAFVVEGLGNLAQEYKLATQIIFGGAALFLIVKKAIVAFGLGVATTAPIVDKGEKKISNSMLNMSETGKKTFKNLGDGLAGLIGPLAKTGGRGLLVMAVITIMAIAFAVAAHAIAKMVGHLVELGKAMLAAPDAIFPMVAGLVVLGAAVIAFFYAIAAGAAIGGVASLGFVAMGVGLIFLGVAMRTMPLEIMQTLAVLMLSLASISFENLTKSFAAVKVGLNELKKEFGDLGDNKNVVVTSMIENLALISTGRATSTATGKAITSAAGAQNITVDNTLRPEFKIGIELDGQALENKVKEVFYSEDSG